MTLRASRAFSLRTVSSIGPSAATAPRRPSRGEMRKSHVKQATPVWANAHAIFAVYCQAASLREAGHDVEVDHIIPLRAVDVCGLHVHNNLQIVSRGDNNSKRNTHADIPAYAVPPSPQLSLF